MIYPGERCLPSTGAAAKAVVGIEQVGCVLDIVVYDVQPGQNFGRKYAHSALTACEACAGNVLGCGSYRTRPVPEDPLRSVPMSTLHVVAQLEQPNRSPECFFRHTLIASQLPWWPEGVCTVEVSAYTSVPSNRQGK